MENSIASLYTECSQLLEQLQSSLLDLRCQARSVLHAEDVGDQVVRFKLWAGNLGVVQWPHSNAFFYDRLEQSPKIVARLKELLHSLSRTLSSSEQSPTCSFYDADTPKLLLLL